MRRLLLMFAAAVLIVSCCAPVRAYHTPESRMLMQIKEEAPVFGTRLERLVFQEGFVDVEARRAVQRIYDWYSQNDYPLIADFLEILNEQDVSSLYELFKQDADISSSTHLPLYEDLSEYGQNTPLALPFQGEMYVLNGNDSSPDHEADGPQRYAWDFVIMRGGRISIEDNSTVNENYYTWGISLLSPASGRIATLSQAGADHAPGASGDPADANFLRISHGGDEVSLFRHIMQDSVTVAAGKAVACFEPVARVGDNGDALNPVLHYQLDKSKNDVTRPMQTRFAVYFARDQDAPAYILVISGIPATGQYVINAHDYVLGRY